MFLTMAVGFFTSRVILNALGISDYGLYNVVGGIVSMTTFLNSGMAAATQRFLTYELGKGNTDYIKTVFCTTVSIHNLIALVILIIAETIGLWFVNTHLNIPADRYIAANWVYQCSIITILISIISVPYNSCIIAHEHMNVYAYVSIYEVIAKLIVAYCIYIFQNDKLIIYAILIALVQVSVRVIYSVYCKRRFTECTYHFVFDKQLFKKMFSFAGWSILGNMGMSFRDQGNNIILNLFFGTSVNAARGIATQLNSYISAFANNFAVAFTPQITKNYASGKLDQSRTLVYQGARYSFFLMSLIVVPFMNVVDNFLELWLGTVPEYTSYFVILTLISSLLYSQTQTLTCAIQATGNVKLFQLLLSILLVTELPIAYLILWLGGKPYMAMYATVASSFLGVYLRMLILKKLVSTYDIWYYSKYVLLRCWSIFFICVIISFAINSLFDNSMMLFVIKATISFAITVVFIALLGISKSERQLVYTKIKSKISKK